MPQPVEMCGSIQLANYQVAVCIQVAVARHLCDTCLATHAKLSMWLCKFYIGSVRKTMVNPRSRKEIKTTHWTIAKTKNSVVLQVYKWKHSRFKSLNFGRGRNMKKNKWNTFFFQFVGLGNLKISGRFCATSPTWSSWHSLPGRKLQGPRSTRESTDLPSHPSSFRVPSESRSTRSIPTELHKSHTAPRIASCNSSLDKAPLPSLSYCFK